MIFQSSNWEDISRYYRNTYVKFKETGERLFFIRRVDAYSVTGTDEDGTEFELFLGDDHPYEVDYILPRKSFYQWGKKACLLQRIPAKQYQRGTSNGNTSITSINKAGGVGKHEVSFDSLKPYVTKQKFPALDEAIANKARNQSVVLSPCIAYAAEARAFFIDHRAIAYLDKPTRSINMTVPIFRNEMEAIAQGSHFKVV